MIRVAMLIAMAAVQLRADPCVADYLRRPDPNYPYTRQPDGRCDGKFAQMVGGIGGLLVVALGGKETFEFDPKAGKNLELRWDAPAGQTIHIRVCSLADQIHYQMDVERPGDDRQYVWPLDIASKVGLTKGAVAVTAWYTTHFGEEQRVYVPIFVGSASTSATALVLSVVPPVQLYGVKYKVIECAVDGKLGKELQAEQSVGNGYYPAAERLGLTIPAKSPTGLYLVSTEAQGGVKVGDYVVYTGSPSSGPTNAKKTSRKPRL